MAETEIGINQFMAEAEIGIRHHDKSSERARPQHLLYDMEQAKTRWRLRSNSTIDSKRVKEILSALGADLCGIASMDRFANASKGYHPLDVFPACKSAISFGCRFPVGALNSKSDVPYTMVRNAITRKLDAMALDFCIELERHQVTCVPVPTNESQFIGAPLARAPLAHCRQPPRRQRRPCRDTSETSR